MKTQIHNPARNLLLAAAIAFALGTAGIASADNTAQDVTEARQEAQIWTTYALSPYLRASDISVSVHLGKATLKGTVEETVSRDLAKQIALGVKGVNEVDNQIMVRPDYSPPARSASRSYGEMTDDATISATIKSKLLWSKHADGLNTEIDTRGGKVTLSGTAHNAAARELAGKLAWNTQGVSSVDNRLVVGPSKRGLGKEARITANEAERDVADAWITTKVKSTFMYSNNVSGSDIGVTTDRGVVTLSGKVDSGAERALAIELAENVRGVKAVHAKQLNF